MATRARTKAEMTVASLIPRMLDNPLSWSDYTASDPEVRHLLLKEAKRIGAEPTPCAHCHLNNIKTNGSIRTRCLACGVFVPTKRATDGWLFAKDRYILRHTKFPVDIIVGAYNKTYRLLRADNLPKGVTFKIVRK